MKQVSLFFLAVFMMGCSKNGNDNGGGTGTTFTITESDFSSTAGREWFISSLSVIYFNSSGGIDSTVNKGGGASDAAWFGTVSNGAQYFATDPLNQFIPSTGTWSLNASAKQLKFLCAVAGCTIIETWQVTSHAPRNAYGESIELMQQQSLSAGRSRTLKLRLFVQ